MIVVDTNVLSELLRPSPDARVARWLHAQQRSSLFTTAITRGEMLYGVLLLPPGRRRDKMHQEVAAIFSVDMADRTLAYDGDAADAYARIVADRRAAGRPISQADAMIAGTARSRGAALATRNVRDFEGCGIVLIDPWH
ncbi:type II toxin-antitoxin system VapC family toxin [Sinimarinibacterium flocculans]|uniref:type II toxin-antitoxin system VapC family toxin n=1 Tax=Sinimarinibacterium flocculans TaxID=985250 RepID=UPI0024900C39|nr:type II toxin-antitoxin system VapC family toxin [Sinimarinibacterium flocculans]